MGVPGGSDPALDLDAAREIKREELGSLSPGGVADIAVLRITEGTFGFGENVWGPHEGNAQAGV